MKGRVSNVVNLAVIVASLGYFVDIYDLVLFNVVKRESLEFIMGTTGDLITKTGKDLFNWQMVGMLVGGLIWGTLGDKRGRISILFGSILLYSIANIANAFVTDIQTYAWIRLVAGIGIAGELGAGITLVSETLKKEHRGYGTMIVVTFGALGAVLASQVGSKGEVFGGFLESITNRTWENWQVAYIVGGVLGLVLLFLRIGLLESGMYKNLSGAKVSRGNFLKLFTNRKRALLYVCCILIGLPIWYVIGILINFSEDTFAKSLGVTGDVVNGKAIMWSYIGLSVGDLLSGLLSQWLRSRKKVVYIYLTATLILVLTYLFFAQGISLDGFYLLCFLLGVGTGYWAIFVTIAAEQFGTNIRSTVTNTVPNFVRGSVPPVTNAFWLMVPAIGVSSSALIVGLVCMVLAFVATAIVKETFSKDLNYFETM
jgi:MFS family permease